MCSSPLADCLAGTCVAENNINLAISGSGSSIYESDRSYINGPIDGNSTTRFNEGSLQGSNYESTNENVSHWWEVDLHSSFIISQIKIIPCEGDLCALDGKRLDQIRVDIINDSTIVSSFFFFRDQAPMLDLILPIEVQAQIVRITKVQTGQMLSLSEVQVIGR